MNSAVLLVIFNRPDKTREVFEAIRAARPARLYVAADGPRPDRPLEAQRCAEARAVIEGVDWPCEVRRLFRAQNLGCKLGVSSAITWLFEHESEGIILEDDVLPLPSFFAYCEQLLERFRDDERVAAVSGCNFIGSRFEPRESYFFSRYCHIWGWATWRRSWAHYDVHIRQWPQWTAEGGPRQVLGSQAAASHWQAAFASVYDGRVDTWDYQWQFSCWARGAVCAVPACNLTTNLGFDGDATHTTAAAPGFVIDSPATALALPLRHPERVARDIEADRVNDAFVYRYARWPWIRRTRDLLAKWLRRP